MGRIALVAAAATVLVGVIGAAACSSFGSSADGTPSGDAAASDAAAADGGASDAATADLRAIHCNSEICRGGDICCVTLDEAGDTTSAVCAPASACAGRMLACDSADECAAGDYCCVSTNGGSAEWSPSSCQHTPCAASHEQLCATIAECGGSFEAGCNPAPAFVRPSGLSRCE